jgi:anti-sigma B factor antagonist
VTDVQIRCRGAAEGTVTLSLDGEIDLANADELEARLDALVTSTTGDLRVDCNDLEFIDSSGLAALVRARRQLMETGRALVIVRARPALRQVLEVLALDEVFIVE